jgi:hypothetical protein
MKPLCATFVILAALIPGLAAAEERCPVKSLDHEVIGKAIKDAPTCDKSLKLFRACGSAASGDVGFGTIVTEKCEAVFAGKQSALQKQAYSRELRTCDTKYADESGSMFRSFEAHCRAQAAHRAAMPFAKVEQKTARK